MCIKFFTEICTNNLFPRSIFELWGHGKSPEELYTSLKNYPVEKMVCIEMWHYMGICADSIEFINLKTYLLLF
jgi:hypothetical protein